MPVSSTYLRNIWENHGMLTFISIQISNFSLPIAISLSSLAPQITKLLHLMCYISIFAPNQYKTHNYSCAIFPAQGVMQPK